uniref:Uncharacterized protein n=1 Tax=viral metagenome TaxID=1070528 RepID=A0A6C0LSH4_9ZZZZ
MTLYIPYYLLAQGVYSGIINGISLITINTGKLIKSVYNHKNPDMNKHLQKLDIEYKLNLIESIINFIPSNYDKNIDPIFICLRGIKIAIENVHNNLLQINKKIAYHVTKWFSSWRTLNIKLLLNMLEMNVEILNNRFNDYVKTCQIYQFNYHHLKTIKESQ